MFEKIKEQINLGFGQQITAFLVLYAVIYTGIWAAAEPLNLEFISHDTNRWRLILIIGTLIITCAIFFWLLFAKNLERFGLEEGDTHLQNTFTSSGKPILISTIDGFQGRIVDIKADYASDEMNWEVKPSTHIAKQLEFIYLPNRDLTFYLRISVISKDNTTTKLKWLRFDPNRSTPQSTSDDEEIGMPLKVVKKDNFLLATVNIKQITKQAFGHHGWRLDKVLLLRARGSGKIKSVTFK